MLILSHHWTNTSVWFNLRAECDYVSSNVCWRLFTVDMGLLLCWCLLVLTPIYIYVYNLYLIYVYNLYLMGAASSGRTKSNIRTLRGGQPSISNTVLLSRVLSRTTTHPPPDFSALYHILLPQWVEISDVPHGVLYRAPCSHDCMQLVFSTDICQHQKEQNHTTKLKCVTISCNKWLNMTQVIPDRNCCMTFFRCSNCQSKNTFFICFNVQSLTWRASTKQNIVIQIIDIKVVKGCIAQLVHQIHNSTVKF